MSNTFGVASSMRTANSCAAKPPKTTDFTKGQAGFGAGDAELLHEVAAYLSADGFSNASILESEQLVLGTLRAMSNAIEARDPYTHGHSERVGNVGYQIALRLHLSEISCQEIYLAGVLHDIGKIGIPDSILHKPGALNEQEWEIMRKHPQTGYDILQNIPFLNPALDAILHHHEKFNGKGYPDKLKGDEIPLMARIIAVADSYDAMVSDRPYRKGMPLEKLEDIFRRGANEQWDPRVIDAFFVVKNEIQKLCESYSPKRGNLLREKQSSRSGIITGRTLLQQ